MNRKAVIYARQSSGKEENSESIQMQLEMCRKLAEKHNLEVIGEFYDANCSGRLYPAGEEELMARDVAFQNWYSKNSLEKKSRPGLRDALNMLSEVSYLIAYDITRLYRPLQSSYLQGYVDMRLVVNHVNVLTVKEGESDPSDFSDSLVATIKSHVNDNQIKLTSEKSKLAIRRLRDSGYLVNGAKMFGIRYVGGPERKIEVIPEKADMIRFVFNSTLAFKPYNWILREMNRQYGHLVEGKSFYISTFRNIIAQPFYCGYMHDSMGALIKARQMEGKEIISLAEWRKANEIVNGKKRTVRHRKYASLPFSGLLECGYCGAKMIVGKDEGKVYYHCITAMNTGREDCRKARVTINLIRENQHYTGLKKCLSPLLLLALRSSIEKQNALIAQQDRLPEIKSRLDKLRRQLDAASEEYLSGHITLNAFTIVEQSATSHICALVDELVKIEGAIKNAHCQENKVKLLFDNTRNIIEDKLEDAIFEELLRNAVQKIRCFYDKIEISTIYGTFTLKRYMDGSIRNFPRFTIESHRTKDLPYPFAKKYFLTYIYRDFGYRKPLFDGKIVKIYAR